jgi:hypothetical protein
VLAVMSLFSGRLTETIKSALNRADLRTKYYELFASDLSQFVFIIDRFDLVYYGSTWATDAEKGALAACHSKRSQ